MEKVYINQNGEKVVLKEKSLRNNQTFASAEMQEKQETQQETQNKQTLTLKMLGNMQYNAYNDIVKFVGTNKHIYIKELRINDNLCIFGIVEYSKCKNAIIKTKIVSYGSDGNIKGLSKAFALYATCFGFIEQETQKDILVSYKIDTKKLNASVGKIKNNIVCNIEIFEKEYINEETGEIKNVKKLVAIPNNVDIKQQFLDYLLFIKQN